MKGVIYMPLIMPIKDLRNTNEISALLYYSKMITLELITSGGNNKWMKY